ILINAFIQQLFVLFRFLLLLRLHFPFLFPRLRPSHIPSSFCTSFFDVSSRRDEHFCCRIILRLFPFEMIFDIAEFMQKIWSHYLAEYYYFPDG
ncbi:hypothetical protein PMAYCL1PPCAC_28419, partial [Pristionchus mayeri]